MQNLGHAPSTTVLLNNSAAPCTADGAARELLKEISGDLDAHGCDGVRIMTFGAGAASRGAGSRAEVPGRVAPVDRRV